MKTSNNKNIDVQDLKRLEEFSVTEITGLEENPEVTKHSFFSADEDTKTHRGGVTWAKLLSL